MGATPLEGSAYEPVERTMENETASPPPPHGSAVRLTWLLLVVGVTALLSGVLARASAVASSLCVMGRGPVAPA